jgi:hypothetical protein
MANQKKKKKKIIAKTFHCNKFIFFFIDKNFKNFNHTKDENCNENTQ